jgi:hypothetical protein
MLGSLLLDMVDRFPTVVSLCAENYGRLVGIGLSLAGARNRIIVMGAHNKSSESMPLFVDHIALLGLSPHSIPL